MVGCVPIFKWIEDKNSRKKIIYFRPKQSNSGRCKSGRAHPRTGVRGVSQDGEVPIRVRDRHPNENPNFARKLQVQEGRSVASSANKQARHYRVRFIPKIDFLRFYAGFCQIEGTSFVGGIIEMLALLCGVPILAARNPHHSHAGKWGPGSKRVPRSHTKTGAGGNPVP